MANGRINRKDLAVGLVHILTGCLLFLVQWGVLRTLGALAILVGFSTIKLWKPGMVLGQVMGIFVGLVALYAMFASLGLKTGSGQPYPGSIVFVLGLILAGWAALLLYPFWRKERP